MADFISREAAIRKRHGCNRDCSACDFAADGDSWCEGELFVVDIMRVPAADVVARDCYDRILAENDTMRKQLAQIGKKPGDRMDDVRPVVKARWYWDNYKYDWCCSNCFHPADHSIDKDDTYKKPSFKFCPHCGTMTGDNLDTTKGEKHD